MIEKIGITCFFELSIQLWRKLIANRLMQTVEVNRIFTPEQIVVHPQLPLVLKEYTKALLKQNPKDITAWSLEYFKQKMEEQSGDDNQCGG